MSAIEQQEHEAIKAELHDTGLLEITLDRPEKLNTLNEEVHQETIGVLESVDLDDVTCVTFEGSGDKAFCAGADISEFGTEPWEIDISPFMQTVDEFPRPVLAKIDGFCLGGGLELALACDLRIATTNSKFGFPEVGLGIIPGGGGTQRIQDELPQCLSKELVLRGNQISAERAAEWKVINRVVEPEEFDDVVDEFVNDLVNGPPIALEKAKTVMDDGAEADLETGLRLESYAMALLTTTEDAEEGAKAFAEDREPEFEGR